MQAEATLLPTVLRTNPLSGASTQYLGHRQLFERNRSETLSFIMPFSSNYFGNRGRDAKELEISMPIGRPKEQILVKNRLDENIPNLVKFSLDRASKQPNHDQGTCLICGSRFERPPRSCVNNPVQIGICVSMETWKELKNWRRIDREKQEMKNSPDARIKESMDKQANLQLRQREVFQRLRTAEGEDRAALTCAWELSKQTLRNGPKLHKSEVEDAWTLYLVRQVDTKGIPRGWSPVDAFNIRLHPTPHDFDKAPVVEGNFLQRARDVWLCLGNSSEEDWHILRRQCLDGTNIDCALTDSSGEFRFDAQLRRLNRSGIMERKISKLLGRPEEKLDKSPQILLCVEVAEADAKSDFRSTISVSTNTNEEIPKYRDSIGRMWSAATEDAEFQKYAKEVNSSSWGKKFLQKLTDRYAETTGVGGGSRQDSLVNEEARVEQEQDESRLKGSGKKVARRGFI